MIKTKLMLAVAIVLSSAVGAAAQTARYDRFDTYRGDLRGPGAVPRFSENPAETGGGSAGYNDNMRRDDW